MCRVHATLWIERAAHTNLCVVRPSCCSCCSVTCPTHCALLKAMLVRPSSCCHLMQVPECMRSLTQLTTLNLDYNNITTLPAWLAASLTTLRCLDLSGNCLTELPQNMAALSRLTHLAVSSNKLTQVGGRRETGNTISNTATGLPFRVFTIIRTPVLPCTPPRMFDTGGSRVVTRINIVYSISHMVDAMRDCVCCIVPCCALHAGVRGCRQHHRTPGAGSQLQPAHYLAGPYQWTDQSGLSVSGR